MIKHVTIDLWLTLIRSHPSYKKERVEKVHTLLNELIGYKGSINAIKAAIEGVDKFNTNLCEKTGLHNMSVRDLWYMVMYHLSIDDKITLEQVDLIIAQCNQLFSLYPPELIDKDTIEILKEITSSGISIDIISNTGFITGTVLKRTFLNSALRGTVSTMYFSDAQVFAKPNPFIFELSLKRARLSHGANLKPSNVLHIGDNPIADIKGATDVMFNTFLISHHPEGGKLHQVPDHIKSLNK